MAHARMTVSVTHRISEAQGGLRLSLVESRADLRRFVEFPYTLYAPMPHWVPPLRRDEYHRLSPRHNPFHDHADMRLWLAGREGVSSDGLQPSTIVCTTRRTVSGSPGLDSSRPKARASPARSCRRSNSDAATRSSAVVRRSSQSVVERYGRFAGRRVRPGSVRADAVQPAVLRRFHRGRRLCQGKGPARVGHRRHRADRRQGPAGRASGWRRATACRSGRST